MFIFIRQKLSWSFPTCKAARFLEGAWKARKLKMIIMFFSVLSKCFWVFCSSSFCSFGIFNISRYIQCVRRLLQLEPSIDSALRFAELSTVVFITSTHENIIQSLSFLIINFYCVYLFILYCLSLYNSWSHGGEHQNR